jgi:hypothetical protein
MPALISSVNSLNIYRNEKLFEKMIGKLRYLSLISFALNDLRDNSTEVVLSHLYTRSN